MVADGGEVEGILVELALRGDVEFSAYRRDSLIRRIERRMQRAGIHDPRAYRLRLRSDPNEYQQLCIDFPVHETAFFRNPACWAYLARDVLPALVAARAPEPVRVWSAGCATGEEAYSAAMLLAEVHGGPAALPPPLGGASRRAVATPAARRPFVVFATDLSSAAIERASRRTYGERVTRDVPALLRDRYLEPASGGLTVSAALGACVILAQHDLLRDPPLPRIDLMICRNVLMYLNPDAQRRILAAISFALAPGGLLLVGAAERPLVWSDRLAAVSVAHGLYRPAP